MVITVKYVIPFLIICIFLTHTSFMIYEYKNWSGHSSFGDMMFVSGGPIKYTGDTTVFYHHEIKIPCNIYTIITLIAIALCIIDLVYNKNEKIPALVLGIWSVLLVLNMSRTGILSYFLIEYGYLVFLPVYYEAFITMEFIPIENFILRVFFGIYILVFVVYTVYYIRNCVKAIKELQK